MALRIPTLVFLGVTLAVDSTFAQNWSFDARRVGMGSPDGGGNLASQMIEEERRYRSIVLPFGLIQVVRDFKTLNPTNDEFDLVRMIEYAAAPVHYTMGRSRGDTRVDDFIGDIADSELSRDLNEYKGFLPVNQPTAGGLAAPTWGKTFRVKGGEAGPFQGVYVGAGPYVSMRTTPEFGDSLIGVLGSADRVYLPNTQLTARNATQGQLAMAVVGGYRGRLAWPSGGSPRDGLYVAANYNYLHGFRFEDIDFRLRLDTDRAGLLTTNQTLPPPLLVSRINAKQGSGMAIDLGVGAVIRNWEFGVGANGVGNRMTWHNATRTSYSHADLLAGSGDLVEDAPVLLEDLRVELPVIYAANVGYDVERWAAVAEFGRALQGRSFRGGGEYRLGRFELRGGAVYSRELWNPTAGVGVGLGPRTAVDVAVYSNSANVERRRNPALAVSLRFNR